ncbi:MAG: hypothetical protein NXI04_03900 [Planctomycetaceae bacterium]|nr:hypothetical protein [Planctomycetaceae bacterium]
MGSAERWAIYALGGGLGHLTRAMAVARAAVQSARRHGRPLQIDVLTNSPFAQLVCRFVAESAIRIRVLPAHADKRQTVSAVHDWLQTTDATTLIVDTFPRGLGGELADLLPRLPVRKVLVQRAMNADYAGRSTVVSAVARYDHVFVPGEPFPQMSECAVLCLPWVVRDFDELLSPAAAADVLGADDGPVVVFVGCGTTAEVSELRGWARNMADQLGEQAHVCLLDAAAEVSRQEETGLQVICHWPLLELLPGVDVMIAGGGYNCVHEARLTGTQLLGIARDRRYDGQQQRLHDTGVLTVTADSLFQHVQQALATGRRPPCAPYANGVHTAVSHLLAD